MKKSMAFFATLILLSSFCLFPLQSKEIVVTSNEGASFVIDVDAEASFLDVIEEIQSYMIQSDQEIDFSNFDENKEISLSYTLGFPGIFAKKGKQKVTRNYSAIVTAPEKENIRLIIRSLAKYNWAQLAKTESTLKKAGDKINHIHPLKFLQTVFTDEELKVGLYVIRNKSIVWGEYYDGLKQSLNEESDLNNMLQFVPDFANNVGVSVNAILPYIQSRQWNVLIDTLINSLPRQGNPDRYDM